MDREMDPVTELLPEDLLSEIRARAADVDRENWFCDEDFEALRERGYLRMLVPREFGGLGFTLEQAARAQRRLATAAPATALGINMHHVIVGIGHTLHLRGDDRAQRIFLDAVAGEVFAFGISEAGNDSVLFDATTSAEPVAEGWRLHGTKIFTSLSPRWTRLLVHARVSGDDDAAPSLPVATSVMPWDWARRATSSSANASSSSAHSTARSRGTPWRSASSASAWVRSSDSSPMRCWEPKRSATMGRYISTSSWIPQSVSWRCRNQRTTRSNSRRIRSDIRFHSSRGTSASSWAWREA